MRLSSTYTGSYTFNSGSQESFICVDKKHMPMNKVNVEQVVTYKANLLHQVGTIVKSSQTLKLKGRATSITKTRSYKMGKLYKYLSLII